MNGILTELKARVRPTLESITSLDRFRETGKFTFVTPKSVAPTPAPIEVTWDTSLQAGSFRATLDGQDVTGAFAIDTAARRATASLAVALGTHQLEVSGMLFNYLYMSYRARTSSGTFTAVEFVLRPIATPVQLEPGQSAGLLVQIDRQGGYTGAVELAATGLPAGIACTTVTIPPAGTAGTLTFTAAPSALPALHTIQVAATGTLEGKTFQRTTGAALRVLLVGDFSMELTGYTLSFPGIVDSPWLKVERGKSVSVDVRVTRTGQFAGEVVVDALGIPTQSLSFQGVTIPPTQSMGTIVFHALPNAPPEHGVLHSIDARGTADINGAPRAHEARLYVELVEAGDFSTSLSPTSLALQSGGPSKSLQVGVTRTGSFRDAVDVTLTTLPAGVTATPASLSIPLGQSAGSFSLRALASAPSGSATVTVTATGTAEDQTERTHSRPLALSVAAPAGGFSLQLAATTLTLERGQTKELMVTIARTGAFAGDVKVEVSAAPGVTTNSPILIPAGQTQRALTFAASATAACARTPLTVTASATINGAEVRHTASATLIVSPVTGLFQEVGQLAIGQVTSGSQTQPSSDGAYKVVVTWINRLTTTTGSLDQDRAQFKTTAGASVGPSADYYSGGLNPPLYGGAGFNPSCTYGVVRSRDRGRGDLAQADMELLFVDLRTPAHAVSSRWWGANAHRDVYWATPEVQCSPDGSFVLVKTLNSNTAGRQYRVRALDLQKVREVSGSSVECNASCAAKIELVNGEPRLVITPDVGSAVQIALAT